MRWEADQRHGFFGWTAPGPARRGAAPSTSQPRWVEVVDLEEVWADGLVQEVLQVWRAWAGWTETAPPFAGGVWSDWPAAVTAGLEVCRAESRAVWDFARWEESQGG